MSNDGLWSIALSYLGKIQKSSIFKLPRKVIWSSFKLLWLNTVLLWFEINSSSSIQREGLLPPLTLTLMLLKTTLMELSSPCWSRMWTRILWFHLVWKSQPWGHCGTCSGSVYKHKSIRLTFQFTIKDRCKNGVVYKHTIKVYFNCFLTVS